MTFVSAPPSRSYRYQQKIRLQKAITRELVSDFISGGREMEQFISIHQPVAGFCAMSV
jgi:hypothetical protein